MLVIVLFLPAIQVSAEGLEFRFAKDIMYSGFSEGRCSVKVDGKYGFIDTDGKMVVPAIFDGVNNYSKGLAIGITPLYADAYFDKAIACEKAGHNSEALESYKLFLQYTPSNGSSIKLEIAKQRLRKLEA